MANGYEDTMTRQKKVVLLTGHLAVELNTIRAMTTIYCKAHHQQCVCEQCLALIKHAQQKLDRCVYGDKKPACKHCPIHCYKPQFRLQAQVVMRYAGPKMLFRHPLLAIKHLIKSTKRFPETIPTGLSNYHQRKTKVNDT